jgi:hypothetical protein
LISINGKSYSGNNIVVNNGKVVIDGKNVTPDTKEININVDGNIESIEVDSCNKFIVNGNVTKLSSISGDIKCKDVHGGVNTISGDVECGKVGGNVSTISGDIENKK